MTCQKCAATCHRHGRNRSGTQRFRCPVCYKTFSEKRWSVGGMYLSRDKVRLVVHLLVEGNSIRSTERLAGVHRRTILTLLKKLGDRCSDLLRRCVRGMAVRHVELDEIWTFVGKKQHRLTPYEQSLQNLGDAYCFIAMESDTKLVLTWHLGKRDEPNTMDFITKVRDATAGTYQISTDGFPAYERAIDAGLLDRADYARIVKVVGPDAKEAVFGNPDLDQTCTSFIERQNGTLRQWCKRMARRTYSFSKKWENLRAALAVHFAYYNFCRIHGSLRVTPAMEAGISGHVWGLDEMLTEAVM